MTDDYFEGKYRGQKPWQTDAVKESGSMKCGDCPFRCAAARCPKVMHNFATTVTGFDGTIYEASPDMYFFPSDDSDACAPMELALALAEQMESDSGDIDGNWPAADRLRAAAERFKK